MNWKEQLGSFIRDLTKVGWVSKSLARRRLEDFISTEIIEKLIADIPDLEDSRYPDDDDEGMRLEPLRQQLKDKWL